MAPHCSSRQLIASIPLSPPPPLLPLPVLIPYSVSLFALVYQNVHLLAGSLITRHSPTPTTISRIALNPFTRRISVHGVDIRDPKERPLLSAGKLSVQLVFSGGLKETPVFEVTGSRLDISATLLASDLRKTNWTELVESLTKADSTSASSPPPPSSTSTSTSSSPSTESTSPIKYTLKIDEPSVTLRIENRSEPLSILRLPSIQVSDEQVSSLTTLSSLANDLVAQVIKDSGPGSFPSYFQKQARGWARQASSQFLNDAVGWGKLGITSLQKSIQNIDAAAKDVAGLESVSGWASKAQATLKGVQDKVDKVQKP